MANALILGSSSRYRRALLERLGVAFECISPDVDETPRNGEAPAVLAARLARLKAEAVATARPDSVVIGADQVAELDGAALGKPGTAARARAQLAASSGRSVLFHTAICVLGPDGFAYEHTDLTVVRFRSLDDAEIQAYVSREQPLDCAGAFRCEGLGITLFDAIENRDPTALIGLPLIAVSAALSRAGLSPLGDAAY